MPHALLHDLRYFLLGLIWLFFLYAARMVLVELKRSRSEKPLQATPPPAPAADRPVALKLQVVEPAQRRGRVFELSEELTLGRSASCAAPFEDDNFTSSLHARIFRRGGEFWLEDLGSTNGTWLNDERLNDGPMRLQRGDRMKIGSTVLEVTR
jgi:pSer/pThr/pTyr-binding forkhead associated (FHA) protein